MTGKVLATSAALEGATGVALLLMPPFVGQLLLGSDLAGVASLVARCFGIALVALGEPERAAEQIAIGLEAARDHELAYDEVMLLELADDLSQDLGRPLEVADTKRAREIRARLGILSSTSV